MSDLSPRLALPLLAAAQAQKHVTHNEALALLDLLVQLTVEAFDAAEPPALPQEGAVWALGPAPTGAWAGQGGMLAARVGGVWRFLAPGEGWRAALRGGAGLRVRRAGAWVPAEAARDNLPGLGVNAVADATNRLAVSAAATLLNHEGAGHRVKVNKATPDDTASLLFQTGFSGRAEMGLAGAEDFSVKVSPDGAAWTEALRLDRDTGAVTTPAGRRHGPSGAGLADMLWTPGGDGVTSLWHWSAEHGQNPRTATIDAVAGDEIVLTTADAAAAFGQWTGFMAGVVLIRIWNLTRAPIETAWLRARPGEDRIVVSDADHIAGWQPGDTIQLGDPADQTPGRVVALDISPMLQQVFGTVFRQTGLILRGQLQTPEAGQMLEVSPSGLGGSFVQSVTTVGAGPWTASGVAMIPCTVPSPVSASNLLFVRERLASTATVSVLSSVAVTV